LSAIEIVEEFGLMPDSEKLQLLLEYSENLPEVPAKYGENPELMERVEECPGAGLHSR
jgi:cysteine desulfuration protein SufE